MQLLENVYMVGSGEVGLSDPNDCHVYLVDGGDEYALIDSGCGSEQSADRIVQNMRRQSLDPERLTTLILTHWHFDHAAGAHLFRDRFGCRVLIPGIERSFLESSRDGIAPCQVDESISDGDRIQFGNIELTAHTIPGHSEGTTGYLMETPGGRVFFSSDIVFINGIIGLINYSGSDLSVYRDNIERLNGLSVDALLPGHMLFTLGNGQRHLDLAVRRLTTEQFVPYNIGQLEISLVKSSRF